MGEFPHLSHSNVEILCYVDVSEEFSLQISGKDNIVCRYLATRMQDSNVINALKMWQRWATWKRQ